MKTKTKKKTVKKVRTVKKQANAPQYTANAIVMGKKYQGKGATVSESLDNLTGMGNIKGKLILTITHDERKRERVIMPNMAFRLFSASKIMHDIALKQVSSLFSDV